jgi:hypothetical protein
VAAERHARLLPWEYEEILVRKAPRRIRVVLLILETLRAVIVQRERVGVEVAESDHVEADRLHRNQILQRRVEPAHAHAIGDAEMEVIDERFIPGYRLEDVFVGECERRGSRRFAGVGSGVEIHRHLLPRARGRVVQRVVLLVLWEGVRL